MHPAFAANAGKSCAAEGRSQIAQEPAVHPRDAHIHLLRNPMAAFQVAGPDRGCESVLRFVGHGHGFLFRIERRNVAYWAKNFFLHAPRRLWKSSIDGGLHVKAVVAIVAKLGNAAASYNRCPIFASLVVV